MKRLFLIAALLAPLATCAGAQALAQFAEAHEPNPVAVGGPIGSPTFVIAPAPSSGVINIGQAFNDVAAPYINALVNALILALVGWGATSGFADAFVYDGSYELYVEDEQMAERLRGANLAAWSNVVRRMLEAANRGLWDASPERLAKLRELYARADEELELK